MTEDTLDEQRPSQGGAFVDNVVRLIKPKVMESHDPTWSWSCRGSDVWDMLCAALTGDVEAIDKLIGKDANLVKAEYWYTQPLHFAVAVICWIRVPMWMPRMPRVTRFMPRPVTVLSTWLWASGRRRTAGP